MVERAEEEGRAAAAAEDVEVALGLVAEEEGSEGLRAALEVAEGGVVMAAGKARLMEAARSAARCETEREARMTGGEGRSVASRVREHEHRASALVHMSDWCTRLLRGP